MDLGGTLVGVSSSSDMNGLELTDANGQVSAAGTRIFVHARIYDEFLAKLTEAAKSFKQGDPFVNDTTQGPLVSKVHFEASPFFSYH